MSLPPAAVLPLLVELDERFVGALLTARVHAFPPAAPGARPRTSAVWACATKDRFWLVARDDQTEQEWRFAVGDPRAVTVEQGWQRDLLHAGPFRVALRRGTRTDAVNLVSGWRRGHPAGDPWPLSVPCPRPAPAAQGALPLPDLSGIEARDDGERWLCAVETDLTWPHTGAEGTIDAPIWVAASDRRTALVAPHPEGGPGWSRDLAPGVLGAEGRWRLGDLAFNGRAPRATLELIEALTPLADPADRLGVATRQALLTQNPRRALQLVGDADRAGRAAAVQVYLGQIALALRMDTLAAAAAWRALRGDAGLSVMEVAELQAREAPAIERTLKAARLEWPEARALAAAAWDQLAAAPPPPEDLPWPPQGPWEAWAAALAAHHRFDDARAAWARLPASTRRAQAEAALATAAGAVDAAARWRITAHKAREEGGDAWRPLAMATGLDETGADRWRWGAWAWADGRLAEARANFRRALALEPEGAFVQSLPPDALRAVAEVARATGRTKLAAEALRRAIAAAPRDAGLRAEFADLLAPTDPAGAADVWASLADAVERHAVDAPPLGRGASLLRASALRAAAGRSDEARRALDDALAADFLDLAVWDAALAQDHVALPPRTRAFRAHLRRLLAGAAVADEGAARAPLDSLDDVALDHAHPHGPAGAAMARRPAYDPPPTSLLLRGLEPLDDGGFPEAAAALDAPYRALGLPVRPIGAVFRGPGGQGIAAWPGQPPVLLLGVDHLRPGPRQLVGAELHVALAVQLVHLRAGHALPNLDPTHLQSSRSPWDQASVGAAEPLFDPAFAPASDRVTTSSRSQNANAVTRVQLAVCRMTDVSPPRTATSPPAPRATPTAPPRAGAPGWFGAVQPAAAPTPSPPRNPAAALYQRAQAERAALLLVGDARAAARAMLKLSGAPALAARLDQEGFISLVREGALPADLALRIADLVRFGAGLG